MLFHLLRVTLFALLAWSSTTIFYSYNWSLTIILCPFGTFSTHKFCTKTVVNHSLVLVYLYFVTLEFVNHILLLLRVNIGSISWLLFSTQWPYLQIFRLHILWICYGMLLWKMWEHLMFWSLMLICHHQKVLEQFFKRNICQLKETMVVDIFCY